MGLLTGLLGLPLAPLRGVGWVLEQAVTEAENQRRDPAPIRQQLAELERDLLAGRISESEFDRREDELLAALERISPTHRPQWPTAPTAS
jgi:cytochrome c-type biogenesis protein CcmH/NrfG